MSHKSDLARRARPVGALIADERRELRESLHRLMEESRSHAPEESYATVPELAIYEALRSPTERGIAQYEHRWDGHQLTAVGA